MGCARWYLEAYRDKMAVNLRSLKVVAVFNVRFLTDSTRVVLLNGLLVGLLTIDEPHAQADEAASMSARLAAPGQAVLFLGDSITYAGQYVAFVETGLHLSGAIDPSVDPPTFYNLGLSSEGVTGLSEEYHPFPRPNVHERLARTLTAIDPDLVIACYGMNDGIYHPFSEERFAAYREGLDKLIAAVEASGSKLVLMTPPPFDGQPVKAKLVDADAKAHGYKGVYRNYDDEVIARYATYVRDLEDDRVAAVIDLHTPLNKHLLQARSTDPTFVLARDGVHPNTTGHAVIAKTILNLDTIPSKDGDVAPLFGAIEKRLRLRRDAWLERIGHKRPGVRPGLPDEALQIQLRDLDTEIAGLTEKLSDG